MNKLDQADEAAMGTVTAELPAEPDENGWMPIETAPRDGVAFLCAERQRQEWKYAVASYLSLGKQHYLIIEGAGGYEIEIEIEPTYWQPLPAPPKE